MHVFTPWSHFGGISINKIKEKTCAEIVLVPVYERLLVPGTSIIAFGSVYGSDTEGNQPLLLLDGVMQMWEFAMKANQQHAVILPAQLHEEEVQKNSFYYIRQLKNTYLWIEGTSKKRLVGRSRQTNWFLLGFDKDKS